MLNLFESSPEFNQSDIHYYLSGGPINKDVKKSIGGSPSNIEISNFLNNLFPKVSKDDIISGSTKYRCFYIFNEGLATLQNVTVSLESENNLATIELGMDVSDEVQQILLSGSPVGGTFAIKYTAVVGGTEISQTTNNIQFIPDEATMSANIQTALNSLDLLSEVTVSAQNTVSYWIFTVTFGGIHGNRAQKPLEITNNQILGDNNFNVKISTKGSPINAIAPNVGVEAQEPFGVDFGSTSVIIGTLDPLDGIAVWLRRTTPADLDLVGDEVDETTLTLTAQVEI